MLEYVLKNNYFNFNSNVKDQISVSAIETKSVPTICMYIHELLGESISQK